MNLLLEKKQQTLRLSWWLPWSKHPTVTVLTRRCAPFVYKPLITIWYLSPIYAPLGLCDSDEREEG